MSSEIQPASSVRMPDDVYRTDPRPTCALCGHGVEHFFSWRDEGAMEDVWQARCHGEVQTVRLSWGTTRSAQLLPSNAFDVPQLAEAMP